MINKKRYVLKIKVALYPFFELEEKVYCFSKLENARNFLEDIDSYIGDEHLVKFYFTIKLFEKLGEDETLIKEIFYL